MKWKQYTRIADHVASAIAREVSAFATVNFFKSMASSLHNHGSVVHYVAST